jgi:asparagine synthase (glutamine-hydrolysing)
MCGIFALLNNDTSFTQQFIEKQFLKGKRRGPEFSVLKPPMLRSQLGFHRLAINGLNYESNQPFDIDNITLICNGEIYNYKFLYKLMGIIGETNSDCEVILHLYKKYGIEETLQLLDGVFSFVLIDYRLENENSKMFFGRDPFGVRPLYIFSKNANGNNTIAVASEMKVLYEFYKEIGGTIDNFPPGTYSEYHLPTTVSPSWTLNKQNIRYHTTGFQSNIYDHFMDEPTVVKSIQYYLTNAIFKRCSTTERPIACLLSGGLDSSLITALVSFYRTRNGLSNIETYSIGLADSEDLKYARIVAEYLNTKHTEIVLSEEEFINAIPHVIESIESYDTTTVRASIGNWLLGKYISDNSDAKVIFNGDGSDELMGGYLYMHKAPDSIEFDKESRRLLNDIYMFDVLRSDKSISSHGLEPRTPFLDRNWVQYYLSIPMSMRNHTIENRCEKYLLRKAFSIEYFQTDEGKPLLPDCILWRKKEAFSDGVSNMSRSLYEIIQEYTDQEFINEHGININEMDKKENIITNVFYNSTNSTNSTNKNSIHLIPKTTEQYYYRKIYESHYGGLASCIPYFWMPKFVKATDASARTLEIYDKEN